MKKMLICLYVLSGLIVMEIVCIARMVYLDNVCEYIAYTREYVPENPAMDVNVTTEIFLIKSEYGRIAIYRQDGTLFDRTDIELSQLPVTIQAKILNGMYINDIFELYDFLETYSS